MTTTAYRFYVGIDWATQEHRVVVLDAARRMVHERRLRHDAVALEMFAQWLADQAGGIGSQVAVGLELTRGAIVDVLLARGFHVFALNPKQLDRFRDRFTVAGAKDDRRDAQVVADALATDQAAFRRLQPEHPLLLELRELSRLEEDLEQEERRLTNRLREQLHRYYPQLLELVPAADEPWLWALLERAPTPAAAQTLPRATVQRLLQRHRLRRLDADAVLAALRRPALPLAPGTVPAAQRHVAVLLPRLRLLHEQLRACAAHIEDLLTRLAEHPEHRDVPILRSVVGVGRNVAATMLAEASRLLAARDYHGLRAHMGTAPITRQSGRRACVRMRQACNPRLRNAAHYWGQSAAVHDASSRAHYARLRAAGHSHARAIRGVVDRLLGVLIAMLKTQTVYDPARRRPLETPA
jgi:transposase